MIGDEFIWCEKYRPKTVKDTILPKYLKTIFQKFVDQKNVPNLLLHGVSGVGKTTIAKAMLEELGCDYIMINGSKERNIDTLNIKIDQFASSVSFSGGRKYIILDEADWLNANSTQPALRAFIENSSLNCGFIFTCNFKSKIIDAIHSRCAVIDFKIPKEEREVLAKEFFKRAQEILKLEKVEFDPKALAATITKFYPDFRRTLNELQAYSATGKIDSGILTNLSEESFKKLISYLKEKNFSELRKWVATIEPDEITIYRKLYDTASEYIAQTSIPELITLLGKYQFQSAFVADHQINLVACLVEIMVGVNFK